VELGAACAGHILAEVRVRRFRAAPRTPSPIAPAWSLATPLDVRRYARAIAALGRGRSADTLRREAGAATFEACKAAGIDDKNAIRVRDARRDVLSGRPPRARRVRLPRAHGSGGAAGGAAYDELGGTRGCLKAFELPGAALRPLRDAGELFDFRIMGRRPRSRWPAPRFMRERAARRHTAAHRS